MGFEDNIHEHNAARRLNILKGFKDFDEIEKGYMDFGGQKPKSNLVQKKTQDKRGFETTRWVKNGEDDKSSDSNSQEQEKESDDPINDYKDKKSLAEQPMSNEELATHAQQTQSEELKKFVEKYSQDESKSAEVAAAKAELVNRGDADFDNENSNEEGVNYEEGERYTGQEGKINFDDPNSLIDYITANRDALVEMVTNDPTLDFLTAAKIHNAQSNGGKDIHGKIDAAQAALDDLKASSGHPDSQMSDDEDGVALFEDRNEAQKFADELGGQVNEDGGMFYITDSDGNEVMESRFSYEEDKSPEEEANEHEETYNKMSDDAKDGNSNMDNDEDNSTNEQVREWIGEDYQDEHINSVIEALSEFDSNWKDYLKLPRQASSPEDEAEMVNQLSDELSSEIQEGNWHGDMDRKDVENVLWGLIKTYNS